MTDFGERTQALFGGLPAGMLTGTQTAETTHPMPILKSIVIKDLPIHLRQAQRSGPLGLLTLDTLGRGKGQPIVFSHGWPLSADDWDTQMLFFLGKGFRVMREARTQP